MEYFLYSTQVFQKRNQLDSGRGFRPLNLKLQEYQVNYTIISRPSYITFECPFCHEEVEVNFEEVDFNTDYWGDGAWCDCPECGEEVELDDYEYD